MCRTPVGSFAYYVDVPHIADGPLILPLHIAYHYQPRPHSPPAASSASTRAPIHTFVHTAALSVDVTLTPNASPTASVRQGGRQWQATCSGKSYQRLQRISTVFLPRLRRLLLDATAHPAFRADGQPAEMEERMADDVDGPADEPPLVLPSSLPLPAALPFTLSSCNDRQRTGLLLSLAAVSSVPPAPPPRAYNVDIEWKQDSPRLYCRELGTLVDCDQFDHSLACLIVRAQLHSQPASGSEQQWRRLGLDMFSPHPPPAFAADSRLKITALHRGAHSHACCSTATELVVAAQPVAEVKAAFDSRFLVSFIREYAFHYAGSTMLDTVVATQAPQTLLTPKRASVMTFSGMAQSGAVDSGDDKWQRQSVQEMMVKVLEAVRTIVAADASTPSRQQWCAAIGLPLLHVLCLHPRHVRLQQLGLAILQLFGERAECHQPLQRCILTHLARHATCQGVLVAMLSLLSYSPAFGAVLTMEGGVRSLLSAAELFHCALLPTAALTQPELPLLPPVVRDAATSVSTASTLLPSHQTSPSQSVERTPSPRRSPFAAASGRVPSNSTVTADTLQLLQLSIRQRSASAQHLRPTAATPVTAALGSPPRQHLSATTGSVPAVPSSGPALTTRSVSFHRARDGREDEQTDERRDMALERRGILKNSPLARARESMRKADEEKEEEKEDEDADTPGLDASPFQRGSGARPRYSRMRTSSVRKDTAAEEKQQLDIDKPAGSTTTNSGSTPSVVIPKLKLSLAFNSSAVSSPSAAAPLASMRYTRRVSRRSDATSRLISADKTAADQQTWHMLSPTSLPPQPTLTASNRSSSTPLVSGTQRFSVLDPELPLSGLVLSSTFRGQSDVDARESLRKLRELAVGAGECCVTSQLSSILWHKKQFTPHDLSMLGWTAGATANKTLEEPVDGWRRKERASASHFSPPPLRSQTSLYITSDPGSGRQKGESEGHSIDLQLMYCTALTLRCLQVLLAATARDKQGQAALGQLSSQVAAVGRLKAMKDERCAILRLPSKYLVFYQQLLHSALHAISLPTPSAPSSLHRLLPAATVPYWHVSVRSAPRASVPLLHSIGLEMRFTRSFASLDAICLLPPALLSPSRASHSFTQLSNPSSSTIKPLMLVSPAADPDKAQQQAGGPIIVARCETDLFYERSASTLDELVEAISRIQSSTPHRQAVNILQQAADALHALHHYAIQPHCTAGIVTSIATSASVIAAASASDPQPFPAASAASSAAVDWCCPCGNSISLLLHTCGAHLIDLHGQLSRLYKVCKLQAAEANARLPVAPVTLAASLLEVPRLCAVNELIGLWSAVLSHPSSHATHVLLVRLLRDATSLREDMSHDQLRFGDRDDRERERVEGKRSRRATHGSRRSFATEQKVALFSVHQFVHHHGLLVFASSASTYCLFAPLTTPALVRRATGEPAMQSARLSLATTLLQRTMSTTYRQTSQPSSAHSQASLDDEDEEATVPAALHPAVHRCRLLVLDFYAAVGLLLSRVGSHSQQTESDKLQQQTGSTRLDMEPSKPVVQSAHSHVSSSRLTGEEDEVDDVDDAVEEDDTDVDEEDTGASQQDEEDDSPNDQRQARRRHRQHQAAAAAAAGGGGSSKQGSVIGGPATARPTNEAATELAWYWSTLAEVLHPPHGVIARFMHATANIDGQRTADDVRDGDESDSDDEDDEPSTSAGSSTSLSASHSTNSPRRRSTKFPSSRLRELDLLSSYCRLCCTLLEWQDGGGSAGAVVCCPWLAEEKLMDATVRFHFIHFIRLYHHSAGLDAVRAQSAALHLQVLTSAASSSRLLLQSALPSGTTQPVDEEGGERGGGGGGRDSTGSLLPSAKPSVVDQVSASMVRLRVVHFLSHELSAEHEAFVTRSYLTAAPATSNASLSQAATVANTARSLAAFSPANSRLSSTLNSPMARASLNSTPLQPMHQLAPLDLTEGSRRQPATQLASPAFNLLKAMSSSAALQAAANREPATGGLSSRVPRVALTPLTVHTAADGGSAAGSSSHRRSVSSPVQLSPENLLANSLAPFQRSIDTSPRTPLCTHQEEDAEEHYNNDGSEAQPTAAQPHDAQRETEEERAHEADDEMDDDGEEDEEDDEAAEVSGQLEEETAMRREHADDTDPYVDELSSKAASEFNSRPASQNGRDTLTSPSKQRAAVGRGSHSDKGRDDEDEGEGREAEADGDDDDGGDDWSYEASEVSVSQKIQRVGLQLAFTAAAAAADEEEDEARDGAEESGGVGDDGDDEDMQYEASELSAAEAEPSPTSDKPRFGLNINMHKLAHNAEKSIIDAGRDEEQQEETDGGDDEEDELLNGWSDSEPSISQRTKRDSTSSAGLKLQLVIPSTSPSASASPSPSESPTAGGEELAAPPRQSVSLPAVSLMPPGPMFRIPLKLPDGRSSRTSSVDTDDGHRSSKGEGQQPTSSDSESFNNSSPSFPNSQVRPFHGRNVSMSLVLSPPSPARSLPLSNHSQPAAQPPQQAVGSFLLESDSHLPGVPEIPRLTIDSGSSSSNSSPYLQPNKLPVNASASQPSNHRTSASLGHVLSPLPRFTASPRHRQSSHASVTDEGNGSMATPTGHHLGGRLSSMSVGGGSKSGKTSSSNEYYNRQRQLRRVYAYPALHVSMLRLVLRLLIDPSGQTLSSHYSDRSLQAANEKADAEVDILTQLHSHINHPRNADVVATLVPDGLQHHSSPTARLLKLLCESLFPSPLFVSANSQQIGRGQFAQVYLMHVPHLPHSLAVKQVDMSSTAHQRVVLYDLYTEVAVMERMKQHDGVVQLLDYGVSKGQYYLVMQAADKSLKAWRDEVANRWSTGAHGKRWAAREVVSPCFNETQLMVYLYLFRRILRAMRGLHRSCIVHFDVKLDNVLLSLPNPSDPTTWQVRLADFGESMYLRDGLQQGSSISRGTENIQSPEMLLLTQHLDQHHHAFDRRRNNIVDSASDVWSVGCLLFELLTNRFLFEAQPGVPIVLRVTGSQSSTSLLTDTDRALLGTFGERPNRPLLRFLSAVLVQNKDRRPSLQKVESMFEQMVSELFPRGLHIAQAMDTFGSPAINNSASQLARRESMMEAAGKREGGKGRSFSMQLDGMHSGATSLLPLPPHLPPLKSLGSPASKELLSSRSSAAAAPHAASSRAKRMARFHSSQLSLPASSSPMTLYCAPLPTELQLPVHCVLPAVWIGARHGRARDMQPDAYFGQCGVPATHIVFVTTTHRPSHADTPTTAGSDHDERLTFHGWQASRSLPLPSTPSPPFAGSPASAEPLELTSTPGELDGCVLWMRAAVSLGGRVLLFVDADDGGCVGDKEQDSLRGLCCAFLMAVYGLSWLQAACFVHDKLPVAAVRANEHKLALPAAGDGLGFSTRRTGRESLFRPAAASPAAAASSSSSAITTRGSVMLGLGAKQHAVVTQSAMWPARLAASLHAWSETSQIVAHASLSVAFRCFLVALPSSSGARGQLPAAVLPVPLPSSLTVVSASSYATLRCLCGSVLVTCLRRTSTRTCSCTAAASPSVGCPAAPFGCRWHIARLFSLYGGQRSALRWKQLLSPSPSLLTAPSSSMSASSLSSLSSGDGAPNTLTNTTNLSARLRHHPLPYSQLSTLQPIETSFTTDSRCRLYECKHCLYPMMAAVVHSSADGGTGGTANAPVLTLDASSGHVLLDGQRVQALHVLAELRQPMVEDTTAASHSSSRSSAAWNEDSSGDGFAYDRRHKALLDYVA